MAIGGEYPLMVLIRGHKPPMIGSGEHATFLKVAMTGGWFCSLFYPHYVYIYIYTCVYMVMDGNGVCMEHSDMDMYGIFRVYSWNIRALPCGNLT